MSRSDSKIWIASASTLKSCRFLPRMSFLLTRFKAFASIPMDSADEALKELHRAINELKMNGVILLSNIGGKALTSPEYRPFFAEANARKLCILLHPMLPANTDPFREYVLGPIVGFM